MLLGKAGEELTGKVTDGLFERLFSPATFFWGTGVLAWLSVDPGRRFALAVAWLEHLSDSRLLMLLVGALALVVLSSAAYEPIADYVLGALAGTWRWLRILGTPVSSILWTIQQRRLQKWQTLNQLGDQRTEEQSGEFDALDRDLKYVPSSRAAMVPTQFGCALVAADRRIAAKYGLLSQTVWPALSIVIPDAGRKAVGDAFVAIQDSCRLVFWSLLALVWSPLNLLVVPIVLVVGIAAYVRLCEQGRDYADAIEAAFDTGRFALYKALRYPAPLNARVETTYGAQISKYLRRGLDDDPPIPFADAKPDG